MSSDNSVLEKAARNALKMMRDSGFELSGKIEFVVDPDLPFMGYSTRRSGKDVIVVAGMAVKSGPIEGLLIHEMCHIYITNENHPSHNVKLLNQVGLHVIHQNQLTKDYQVKLVQQAVNHVQDLYADDISFKVFEKSKAFTPEQAFNFFLDWIQDSPSEEKSDEEKWQNIGTMLNNCFAISNLIRHKIPDIDNQAENAVQRFLSKVNGRMRSESSYFRNFMTNLTERVTRDQFEKDLTEYLTRIVQLSKQ